jgi:hypothetical protein
MHSALNGPPSGFIGAGVMPSRIQVLVLYHNPLLGEGLAGLLRTEPRLVVSAAATDSVDEVERALAARPVVIVLEDGDGVGRRDLMRRAACQYLIQVSLTSSEAQVLSDPRSSETDGLPLALVTACLQGEAVPAQGPTGAAA